MDNILVSINCVTYNHENYISDAIDSFLKQKTKFKYEILIHDDASTDRTVEIIKEYQNKYPDIIKPIFQTENQYIKGVKVYLINVDRAKGKYIANCDGDDFWTDPYKLQKQVDYMEKHPECSICVHASNIVNTSNEEISFNRPSKVDKVFSVGEVIEGGGNLFGTSSMFYRTDLAKNKPDFYDIVPDISDYPVVINLSLLGTVYYMEKVMSSYRVGDEGSWTAKNLSDKMKKKEHYSTIAKLLDEVNRFTKYKYNDAITRTKRRTEFMLLLEDKNFKKAKKEYKDLYFELSYKKRLIIFLDYYTPKLSQLLRVAIKRVKVWRMT
jgi:glycosyltransferase involved in cell wall biosynthesis